MTSQRNEPDTKVGQERAGTGEALQSREGDPRVRDGQDLRTAGSERGSDRAKDDPSRAPESGTP
jgi:hypothetical protein